MNTDLIEKLEALRLRLSFQSTEYAIIQPDMRNGLDDLIRATISTLQQAQEDTRRLDRWAHFIRSAIGSQTISRHIESKIHLGRDVREVLDEADRCNTASAISAAKEVE